MRTTPVHGLTLALIGMFLPVMASAQETLVPSVDWHLVPVFSVWHFGTALPQAAGDVQEVQQVAIPVRARFQMNDRWTFDVSAALSSSRVRVTSSGASRSLSLSGLSDVNVRITGPLVGDAVMLTAGVNLPTGSTGLDADQTTALQVIASPALGMPTSALGLGLGGTVGLIGVREVGEWALAFGGSLEQRTEYTPVALAIAGGQSRTTLAPGIAMHFSIGGDRSVGDDRASLLMVGDVYAKDKVTTSAAGAATPTQYTLGPQVTAIARYEFAVAGWREAAFNGSFRWRSPFSDASGASVSGSNGSYLEASVGGVRGAAGARGLILTADARYQSGLSFTEALVGAAVTSFGATVGVDVPFAQSALRLALHGQVGSLSTGQAKSTVLGLQLSGSFATRGGSR